MIRRRPGRPGALPRAAIAAALLVALLAEACAPAAVAPVTTPNPAQTAASSLAAALPATPLATTAPTLAPTLEPVGVTDDDDVEGDPLATLPSPSAVAAPATTPTLAPTPKPTPAPPKEPLEVSLYHANDWVGQYTLTWCVGASIQMMVNIALPGQDRTRDTQAEYQLLAQGGTELDLERGAGSRGWARALGELGAGEYRVTYAFTYADALRTAARAMRLTRRPVGLLVWGGKHAWVMTGFTSIGDPRHHDDFEVTGIRVLDPLYPRYNADLGPSPRPNSLLKPSQLDDYFVGWRWRTRNTSSSNSSFRQWRLVLPVSA